MNISNLSINQEVYDIVDDEALHFTEQTLTPEQQVQARTNILGSYSTDEQDTGMRWIDGKPIYRRVFTGTLKASTSIQVLSNIGYDTVIRVEGTQYIPDTGTHRSMNYYNSGTNNARIFAQSDAVTAYSTSAGNVWGIIEYTKVNDTATTT